VKVSSELFQLIRRSLKVSELSNGYFDISFASAERFWKFDESSMERPDEQKVLATVSKVDYSRIELNEELQTVFLKDEGMRIGFGAIGKGYAANRVRAVMKEAGIQSGVVNAGGDLLAWGKRPDGKVWTIGVANPDEIYEVKAWLDLTDMAVVTSGNYEKYVMIDGVRHGHIIDPKTGWPARGLTSVTLVCPDAELADALATTVFVLGLEEGLRLVNHLKAIEAILIDDGGTLHYSDGIQQRILTSGN
jgi:thiamine biosynthesis lipoprotein